MSRHGRIIGYQGKTHKLLLGNGIFSILFHPNLGYAVTSFGLVIGFSGELPSASVHYVHMRNLPLHHSQGH